VGCGKGGRRREVNGDGWAWERLQPSLTARLGLAGGRCSAS
jgi:hypothetical protein